ncbi:hypothetical protein, partial [Nocardioides sp. P5_C9_2]
MRRADDGVVVAVGDWRGAMRVQRGNLSEVVAKDGRCTVYVDDQVIVLSEMSTVILEAIPAVGFADLTELTTAVVNVFGPPLPPADASALTRGHVLDLVAHGVLADDTAREKSFPTRSSAEALRDALRHIRSSRSGPWTMPVQVTP